MKKICFIAQFPPPIHGLSKAVQTLFDSNLDNNEFIFEKIDITNNKLFLLTFFRILKSNADLFYFTISQTSGGNIRDLIILKLINLKKKKYIIHLHGGKYYRKMVDKLISKFRKRLNYILISNAEIVIVLSESLKSTFEGMIDEKKIIVVPNCVDKEFLLSEKEIKQKSNNIIEKEIKDILYLSNFIKEKGYEYVLQLAKKEKENYELTNNRNFHFHFAGKFFDNEDKCEFFDYIQKNKLDDYISYHAIVSGNKKKELLKKSDVLVLLTTYFREGQPISILEAMGNGMAILSTNHSAIPDMMNDNTNGILVDKNNIDINEIYERLLNLDYYRICHNNYENSFKYSENNYLKNMYECFEKVF